jgi:GNAT superfamily N-acetyltransferase
VKIELLPPEAADTAVVAELRDLVNRVYEVAEEGMWPAGKARIDSEEMRVAVRGGQIAVATVDGRVVGSVRVRQLDSETGEFGLLVAAPEHRGIGVGRELVRFAESLMRSRGMTTMQLRVLAPLGWAHPVKKFLHEWYSRMGYAVVGRRPFDHAVLLTPCEFAIYEKPL